MGMCHTRAPADAVIDLTVDTYTLWGPVCDCEDGEDVRLTVSYIEYDVNMAKVAPPDSTE